jgi:tripartite-type tricarboxylate transporter receptor subunit TctC
VLAVTSKKRWPDSPDVPTIAETVSADFEIVSWTGIGVPAGTPQPIVEKLHAEVHRALALPEVQERLRRLGVGPRLRTEGR